MDNLLEAINDYHKNHGHYPKVKVNREFAYSAENYEHLVKLQWNYNTDIEIDETVDQWELE